MKLKQLLVETIRFMERKVIPKSKTENLQFELKMVDREEITDPLVRLGKLDVWIDFLFLLYFLN